MKKFLFIVIACSVLASCGVKDDPEYKSQKNYNNYFLIEIENNNKKVFYIFLLIFVLIYFQHKGNFS